MTIYEFIFIRQKIFQVLRNHFRKYSKYFFVQLLNQLIEWKLISTKSYLQYIQPQACVSELVQTLRKFHSNEFN